METLLYRQFGLTESFAQGKVVALFLSLNHKEGSMDWLFRLIARWLSDDAVQSRYVQAGASAGSSISYLGIGTDIGLVSKVQTWAFWEAEYTRRGFEPVSCDQFVNHGGYGAALNGLGRKGCQPASKGPAQDTLDQLRSE